jgi:hypothetical protein
MGCARRRATSPSRRKRQRSPHLRRDRPGPFVAPFFDFLLERTPKPPSETPLTNRKDEYPDGA